MTISAFRLPRKHLPGVTPRMLARSRLATAPRADLPPDPTSPLDAWNRGFSRQAAVDYYEELGGRLPARPETDPSMPDDVTRLSSEDLGTLYAQFVAYTEWLEAELALVQISADEEDSYLEHVEAEIHLRKAGTVSDKKSKTKHDARFIETEMNTLAAKAKAKLLRARVSGYERCANALSREMTRRTPPGD